MGDGSPGPTPGGNKQSSCGLGTRLPSHIPAHPKARRPPGPCPSLLNLPLEGSSWPGEHAQTTFWTGHQCPGVQARRATPQEEPWDLVAKSSPALPPGRVVLRCYRLQNVPEGRPVAPVEPSQYGPCVGFLLSLSHCPTYSGGFPHHSPDQLLALDLSPPPGGNHTGGLSCPSHAWADISHLAWSLWAQLFRILPCPSSGQP